MLADRVELVLFAHQLAPGAALERVAEVPAAEEDNVAALVDVGAHVAVVAAEQILVGGLARGDPGVGGLLAVVDVAERPPPDVLAGLDFRGLGGLFCSGPWKRASLGIRALSFADFRRFISLVFARSLMNIDYHRAFLAITKISIERKLFEVFRTHTSHASCWPKSIHKIQDQL